MQDLIPIVLSTVGVPIYLIFAIYMGRSSRDLRDLRDLDIHKRTPTFHEKIGPIVFVFLSMLILAFIYHRHPWVVNRLELRHTRVITSADGNFSISIPESWTFAEGMSLAIAPGSRIFVAVSTTLSPLKEVIMQPDERENIYVSAARNLAVRRSGDGHVHTYMRMSVSRTRLPIGVNLSPQALNGILLAALQRTAGVSRIRQETRILNGRHWAITTLDFQGTPYVLWQYIDRHNHYIVEFRTERLPLIFVRRTFEYIMSSFSLNGQRL